MLRYEMHYNAKLIFHRGINDGEHMVVTLWLVFPPT